MKKKALLASILTIAMCFSIIAGATYALFTSESGVDVAITAGNVDVVATINEGSLKTYSLDVEQKPGYFANRGTATLTSTLLTLTNVTPGDRADFTIDMTNNSNVDIQYRVKWAVDGELYSMLNATADGKAIVNNVSGWSEWLYDAEDVRSIDVSVELPYTVGNEGENQTAEIQFFVEAVQGNAILEEVATEDQLRVALEMGMSAKLIDNITLENGLTIPSDAVSVIDLNGYTITNPIESTQYTRNAIVNKGTLSIVGPGTITSLYTYSVNNTGNITIIDATLTAGGLYNAGNATLTNATIENTSSGRHAIYNAGNLEVNGGNYSSTSRNELINSTTKNAVINGGTFTMIGKSYLFNANVTLIDGNFNGYVNANGTNDMMRNGVTVYGGTFNFNPTSFINNQYFTVTDNGNGTWSVNSNANTTVVKNAADFLALSEKSLKDHTVLLVADVDLGGAEFKSMIAARSGALTFKGNGHTVSGVNFVSGNGDNTTGQAAMFYCFPGSTLDVSNLTIANSTVTATPKLNGYAAAVIGYCEGNATLTNVDVENVDVIGSKSSGSLVGHLSASGNLVATDCNVTDSTVTLTDKEEPNGHYAGKAIGTIAANATLTNCSFDATVSGHLHANNVGDLYGRYIGGKLSVDGTVYARTADQFVAAVNADAEYINVVMTADIDVSISALGKNLGGADTKAITIDLGGKKLNVTTTYACNLGAENVNATFTIKNGTMTNSKASGTWDTYDMDFSNCNYVIENVVFDKAVAFSSTVGKTITLTNVTINETHDYYALWISAEGQTVTIDGLTINSAGRGIKVDEEYVKAENKGLVNLTVKNATFNTVKKAAIVVKSVKGANITLKNVNIENAKADTANAVWVDEDSAAYADLVTVNGGTVVVEQ